MIDSKGLKFEEEQSWGEGRESKRGGVDGEKG